MHGHADRIGLVLQAMSIGATGKGDAGRADGQIPSPGRARISVGTRREGAFGHDPAMADKTAPNPVVVDRRDLARREDHGADVKVPAGSS